MILPIFLFVGWLSYNLVGAMYDVLSSIFPQLFFATESPGYSYALYASIECCLHIHTRVSYIYSMYGRDTGCLQYVIYYRRVGFDGHSVTLAIDNRKAYIGEEMPYQFLCRLLILIGGHSNLHSSVL